MHILPVLERLTYRYPSVLVDAVTHYEPGRRIRAVKNVTVNEEFFQGHFPGTPLMPGVLMIESLTQVASLLLLSSDSIGGGDSCAWLRGVDNAKFRRQVVPGDRLEFEVTLGRRRGRVVRTAATASVDGQIVAEADLIMGLIGRNEPGSALAEREELPALIHPTAIVHPDAVIGDGTMIGPYATVGPHVRIGRECFIVIHGQAVIERGHSIIGHAVDGSIIGECALMDPHGLRNATVTAATDMELLVMSRVEFRALRALGVESLERRLAAAADAHLSPVPVQPTETAVARSLAAAVSASH